MVKVLMFPSSSRALAVAIANSLGAAEMLAGPTVDVVPVIEKEITAGDMQQVMAEEDSYRFNEKPVAKSSTSILVSAPGAIACPSCGCRSVGANETQAVECRKKGCTCKCH